MNEFFNDFKMLSELIGLFFRREFAHKNRTLIVVLFQVKADKQNDVFAVLASVFVA